MKRLHLIAAITVAWSLTAAALLAADGPTSKTDSRLEAALKTFPQADADRDGILTFDEALRYRRSIQRKPAAPPGVTAADIRYGPHPRNLLDFYRAKSDQPAPVLIHFHGGGFVAGDKRAGLGKEVIDRALASGVALVAANYRLVAGPDSEPFPGPMNDGARVIQFVRAHAKEWNIDPGRVALTGGSAGACMSLWLALHADLADPSAADPVARQSTRVSCVVAFGGQSSLDPAWIRTVVGGNPDVHPSLLPFYGVKSPEELSGPRVQQLIREASPINHASKGDPPLYLVYNTPLAGTPLPPTASVGTSIHHAQFGKLLKDKYEALGIECVLKYQGHAPADDEWVFLRRQLKLP